MHIPLGSCQIQWLSDLKLFDFEIKYRAGRTNQAADALSWWPENLDSSSESSDGEEEWETITYGMVCQILDYHLNTNKLPYQVKHEIQTNIVDVDEANYSKGFKSTNVIDVQLREVKIFNSSMPKQMAEFQKGDSQLSLVYEKVLSNQKPRLSEIHRISSKPIHRLLLQFDRLTLIRGVLHCRTFKDDDEIQQLILPQCL